MTKAQKMIGLLRDLEEMAKPHRPESGHREVKKDELDKRLRFVGGSVHKSKGPGAGRFDYKEMTKEGPRHLGYEIGGEKNKRYFLK